MKQAIYIQVPSPCHEDWSKMTPAEQGKHCSVCARTVVDFSAMSDEQVLSFFSRPRGGTCGNFSSDQLNRIIKEPASPKRKKYWAMLFSFLLPLFATRAKSQTMGKVRASGNNTHQQTSGTTRVVSRTVGFVSTIRVQANKSVIRGIVTDTSGQPVSGANVVISGTSDGAMTGDDGRFQIAVEKARSVKLEVFAENFLPTTITVKMVADTITQKIMLRQVANGDKKPRILCNPPKTITPKEPSTKTIKGNVADIDGAPIPGASIVLKGTHAGTSADSNGDFSITINDHDQAPALVVSAIGYQTREVADNDTAALQLKLQQSQITLGEVVVVTSPQRTVGRLAVCTTREKRQRTVKDTVKNLLSPAALKVFPNPANASQFVYVQPTLPGDYQLRLFNLQGQLILQRTFAIKMKKQSYQLELPATVAAGTYLVEVFHTESRKVYTQQLVIR